MKFTAENAAIFAKKSHDPASARFLPKAAKKSGVITAEENPQDCDDPMGNELSRVQWELIGRMRGNDDAKAVSALAQALKNVRETYHLVTGQAKPGVLRESKGSKERRSYAKPTPALTSVKPADAE